MNIKHALMFGLGVFAVMAAVHFAKGYLPSLTSIVG